eukprot:6872670-Alexandrium_andersonii.AAC.1
MCVAVARASQRIASDQLRKARLADARKVIEGLRSAPAPELAFEELARAQRPLAPPPRSSLTPTNAQHAM